jgi:sulfonate transport system substrate-binding protein
MHRRQAISGMLGAAALGALGGCGDDEAGAAAGGALRIGYQRFGGLSLVKARQAYPAGTWSLFESGPALTEALKAGAIDVGQTGEAPPIFAAAAGTEFTIAGVSKPAPRGEAVLVKKAKGFTGFADLRGRTVALNKGSNVHWLLVKLLEKHGMTLDDLTVRYLKPAEGRPAFDNDQVDAWVIWEPYFALAENPGVQVLADATGVANNREYILASPSADRARIQGFLKAYQETMTWGIAHPDERTKALAPELKITEAVTARALARTAEDLDRLTPAIGDELQTIADGFAGLKLIPRTVDMRARLA